MSIEHPEAHVADTVGITIPPRAEYVSIARLATAAVAVRQAFPYDEVEDLKIAVSEACGAFIATRGRTRSPITVHFIPEDKALAIWIEAPGSEIEPAALAAMGLGRRAPDERTLGIFLMQCLVDEVRCIDRGGSVALRLLKRRPRDPDGGPSSPA